MYSSCTPQWGPNAIGSLPSLLFIMGCSSLYSEKPLFPERPHIVFMLIDDLGWNDVSFHGSKQIPTPNIDAIARDGIILNQYYVQHICSPSRGSLMTGKYPIKIGFQHDVIISNSPWGLPLTEKILPQYLKELEYSTHAVGKWHLGFFKKDYLPNRRGFDSFFGYYTGVEDYFTHVSRMRDGTMQGLDLRDNEDIVRNYNGTYGSDLFTTKAKKVIFEHDPNKPLFLYLAQQAVHSGNFQNPLQALDMYVKPMVGIKDEIRKTFAGGKKALKQLPMSIDGIDQWPSIVYDRPSPRSEILLNIDDIDNAVGIRKGRYKLVKGSHHHGNRDKWYDREGRIYNNTYSLHTPYEEMTYRENYFKFLSRSKAASVLWYKYGKDPRAAISCSSPTCEELLEIKCGTPPHLAHTCNALKEPCLYDIIRDPCEHHNIAKQIPELISQMEEAIERYRTVSIPPKWIPGDPDSNPDLHGNAWKPWK